MEDHIYIPPGWRKDPLAPFTGVRVKGGSATMAKFVRKEHELEAASFAVDRRFKAQQERRLRGHH